MTAEFCLVYITIDKLETAETLVKTLIDERIIACANIIEPVRSIYRWQGEICVEKELIIISKCQKSVYQALEQRVKELHPYDCPCIVSLPVEAGLPDYFKWLTSETGPESVKKD